MFLEKSLDWNSKNFKIRARGVVGKRILWQNPKTEATRQPQLIKVPKELTHRPFAGNHS